MKSVKFGSLEALWHLPLGTLTGILPILSIFSLWLLLSCLRIPVWPRPRGCVLCWLVWLSLYSCPKCHRKGQLLCDRIGGGSHWLHCRSWWNTSTSHGFICIVNGHVNHREILSSHSNLLHSQKAVINCQAEQSMEHKGIVSKLIYFYYEHSSFSWL